VEVPAPARLGASPTWWRDPAVGSYLGTCLLGVVQAVVLGPAVGILRATVPALVALVVVLLVRWSRADVDDARGWAWVTGLGVAACLVAASAVASFARAFPVGLDDAAGFYRVKVLVTTPVGEHNTAAAVLLVAVVVTAVLAGEDRRWYAGVVLTTLGLVATLSRGAAVVLVGVGLLATVTARREVARTLCAAAAVTLAVVTGFAGLFGAAPPAGAAVPDGPLGASLVGRIDLAIRGLEIGGEHPWLGVGMGRFVTGAEDLPFPNTHAHNAAAQAFAEGGVVLLSLVVAITLLVLVRAWRQPPGWRRELTLLGGAGLILHAQLDIVGGQPGPEVTLAALVALAGATGPAGTAPRRATRDGASARPLASGHVTSRALHPRPTRSGRPRGGSTTGGDARASR
jgi:O-antigen ligase